MNNPPINKLDPFPKIIPFTQKFGMQHDIHKEGIPAYTQSINNPMPADNNHFTPTLSQKPPTLPITIPLQQAKDFLNIVKKGDINEIMSFIGILGNIPLIDQYNIDVSKVVDDNFRQTCLYYAALIKNPETYINVVLSVGLIK